MRKVITIAPITGFLFAATLFVTYFNDATKQATQATENTQPLSPSCTDITKVQEPVIAFGFDGSYRYTVEINPQGEINAYDPQRPGLLPPNPSPIDLNIGYERDKISAAAVKGLVRLATQEAFWRLPTANPKAADADTLVRFVTVNLPCGKKHIVVPNTDADSPQVQPFTEMFMLLADLVYDEPAGYKPLH